MKLHILSDLHFEFSPWPRQHDVNAIEADVTILAGDIGVGLMGLQWALSIQRPVIYVMGNHEFYGQRPMSDLCRKAREKVAGTHVHLLENGTVLLDDPQRPGEPVRFLGATLWTDFCILGPQEQEACMEYAGQWMTDYQSIRLSQKGRRGARLTPQSTLEMHHESRTFLEAALAHPADGAWCKTVIVTHHAPSAWSLINQDVSGPLDAAYASHLGHLVSQADLWVHGHTHLPVDYSVGSGRVVSNPRGYIGHEEVCEFNPALVVEV